MLAYIIARINFLRMMLLAAVGLGQTNQKSPRTSIAIIAQSFAVNFLRPGRIRTPTIHKARLRSRGISALNIVPEEARNKRSSSKPR